jgi:ATP-dependent Clp protease adaptor protein ClpS
MKSEEIKSEQTQELELMEVGTSDTSNSPAKVILYNDDWHTFEEVINQILKAIKCSQDHAEALTWEVHNKGKACVYEGEMNECLRVSSVLEEIQLHTQIEY